MSNKAQDAPTPRNVHNENFAKTLQVFNCNQHAEALHLEDLTWNYKAAGLPHPLSPLIRRQHLPNLQHLTISGADPYGLLAYFHAPNLRKITIVFNERASTLARQDYRVFLSFLGRRECQLVSLTICHRDFGDLEVAACLENPLVQTISSVDISFAGARRRWINFMTSNPRAVELLGGADAHELAVWYDRDAGKDFDKAHVGWFHKDAKGNRTVVLHYAKGIVQWCAAGEPWNRKTVTF